MITGVFVSPDGQELAVQTDDELIVVCDPHEDGAELIEVGHVEAGWQRVYGA
jgi:hypothetical protein